MKEYRYIGILFLAIIGFTSCNKWLEIDPKDQVVDENLFEDYRGFRNALNGIYTSLATSELYGRELSWGLASVLGQDYMAGEGDYTYQAAQRYNYEYASLKSRLATMWSTAYNIIANCNKLIEETEKQDASFFLYGEEEKGIILGEALAVRALLHFDLCRLFAPAPALNDKTGYMPYRMNYSVEIASKWSADQVLQQVAKDLLRAKDLVAPNDTILNRNMLLNTSTVRLNGSGAVGGTFFGYRGVRLNYVAINGLLARVYMYAGDYTNAKHYAEYVYNKYAPDEDDNTSERWGFSTVSETTAKGKFSSDMLFGLSNKNLVTDIANLVATFGRPLYLNGIKSSLENKDQDDYRWKLIYSDGGNEKCVKWDGTGVAGEDLSDRDYSIIPVIRLSEIFYILTECYVKDGNATGAAEILNEVRKHRGESREIAAVSNDVLEDLHGEIRKEYMTEGQTFFFYKRLNQPIRVGIGVIPVGDKFVIPTPDSEDVY